MKLSKPHRIAIFLAFTPSKYACSYAYYEVLSEPDTQCCHSIRPSYSRGTPWRCVRRSRGRGRRGGYGGIRWDGDTVALAGGGWEYGGGWPCDPLCRPSPFSPRNRHISIFLPTHPSQTTSSPQPTLPPLRPVPQIPRIDVEDELALREVLFGEGRGGNYVVLCSAPPTDPAQKSPPPSPRSSWMRSTSTASPATPPSS